MSDVHSSDDGSSQNSSSDQPPRSLAEQVSFSLAALLLTTLVGLICYLWLGKRGEAPPNPILVIKPVQKLSGQFHVPFELTNQGDNTAASVQVVAELRLTDILTETGEQQIDFLSSQETESGAFIFSQDPRKGTLTIRVASYKSP
ncbi:MAG: TIGR02588 family protein [Leptolyngbyaceae cyanobacterium CSU_1_4]|nr:TIGR02588 family protein [Leptolyngbyaceae cyanobacterium CSU_1_4]